MNEYLIMVVLSALFLLLLSVINWKAAIITIIALIFGFAVAFVLSSDLVRYLFKSKERERVIRSASKTLIYAIPVVVILYLLYMNFAPVLFDSKMDFSLDVGSAKEGLAKGIAPLSPSSRVGNKMLNESISYRELLHPLVYSSMTVPSNTGKISVSVRFKDNFPENSSGFYIGAQDKEDWHYLWKPAYLLSFDFGEPCLTENSTKLYCLRNESTVPTNLTSFISNPPADSVIATNLVLEQKPIKIENYSPGELAINTTLRGNHAFYVYASGYIQLTVSKQDINWYENEDNLTISVYDLNNTLIATGTIPDDGITNNSRKQANVQNLTIFTPNIEEGVYRIELINNGDMIIKQITINQNKFVADKNVFLADNGLYSNSSSNPSTLYFKNKRESTVYLSTYHSQGFQNISINRAAVNLNETQTKFNLTISPGDGFSYIYSPKNDIMISSVNYFSFTRDSYFEPFEYGVIGIDDANFVKANADYILTDYTPPVEDNGWLIGTAEFDAKDLYIKDNKLSIILNAKHLGSDVYSNYTIPVDWVNVSIDRKGLIR